MGLAPWVQISGSIRLDLECFRLPLGVSGSSLSNENNRRSHLIVQLRIKNRVQRL